MPSSAAGLPLAVGLALADKLQKRQRVTACLFGDGAVAEGAFHESLNLAALWKLPVLFLCENNLYAMGTAIERHQSRTDIHEQSRELWNSRGAGRWHGRAGGRSRRRRLAVDSVRSGAGPFLLEARTYRFRRHSMYDAELYRTKSEVEQWKRRDPISLFTARLRERLELTDDDLPPSRPESRPKSTRGGRLCRKRAMGTAGGPDERRLHAEGHRRSPMTSRTTGASRTVAPQPRVTT